MKVVIAGAGRVGENLARYLALAGNEVTLIDPRVELLSRISERYDVETVLGYGSHPTTLGLAGLKSAAIFIAVTASDEVNMVACQIAHSLFRTPTKIARIRQHDYREERWQDLYSRENLPIDVVIAPEVEVAKAIALDLELPGVLEAVPFAGDRARLVGVRCDARTPIIDTPLRQLSFLFPDLHLNCVGIARAQTFFIPDADDQLLIDDEVYFVVETSQLDRALSVFGRDIRRSERVVIAGGGNVGLFLARELERRQPHLAIRIIEADPARAELLSERLKRADVIIGDARNREILDEAGTSDAHAVVTITNNDEINIMVALLSKRMGCGRALTLINNSAYDGLIQALGVDVAINPRDATVSCILRQVRHGRVRSVYTLKDGVAEVFEIEVQDGSQAVGRPLREIGIAGVIAGAVLRGETFIAPRADTVIRPKDRIVVAARADAVRRAEQLFSSRTDYF